MFAIFIDDEYNWSCQIYLKKQYIYPICFIQKQINLFYFELCNVLLINCFNFKLFTFCNFVSNTFTARPKPILGRHLEQSYKDTLLIR